MEWREVVQEWVRGTYLDTEKDCKWYHSPYARWIDIGYGDWWKAKIASVDVDITTLNTEDEEYDPDDVTEVY